jgi:probable rRNA maturation factor
MMGTGDSTTLSAISKMPGQPGADEPDGPLAVEVVHEDGDWRAFGACNEAVQAAVSALARHKGCSIARGTTAAVVLASDATVHRLNLAYRGKDAPTNVLSFPFQPPPGVAVSASDASYLGDVILADETIRREAGERGIEPVFHLQHLVVHGLLHLLGHDHAAEPEAAAMERLEADILAQLGIADPYDIEHPE